RHAALPGPRSPLLLSGGLARRGVSQFDGSPGVVVGRDLPSLVPARHPASPRGDGSRRPSEPGEDPSSGPPRRRVVVVRAGQRPAARRDGGPHAAAGRGGTATVALPRNLGDQVRAAAVRGGGRALAPRLPRPPPPDGPRLRLDARRLPPPRLSNWPQRTRCTPRRIRSVLSVSSVANPTELFLGFRVRIPQGAVHTCMMDEARLIDEARAGAREAFAELV